MRVNNVTFEAMETLFHWLEALGAAGFMFFLLKGIGWLAVFWLISRGIIRKHTVAKFKWRWRNLWRREG